MADPEQARKLELITGNLAEVLDLDLIKGILADGRNLKIYWGTATTGVPHAGYFVPAIKIAEFLEAGCEVTLLLADLHAVLDSNKSTVEVVEYRVKYYEFIIRAMLRSVGVSLEKLKFVVGSSYQRSPEYIMDIFRLSSAVSEHDAKRAGAEIVKQSANAPLSSLLYPILQILDEEYLGVDVQFGGVDQRKLFVAAKEWLPRIGYKQRAHLLNPIIPGLQGKKMSSSDEDSKINLLDPPDLITKKLRKAVAAPMETQENGLLDFVEFVLLPAANLAGKKEFRVERHDQEPLIYTNIQDMQNDYRNDTLTPQLLKPAITSALIRLVTPIQEEFNGSQEWQEITSKAYPPPPKKEKKVKNKGTLYPGKKNDN